MKRAFAATLVLAAIGAFAGDARADAGIPRPIALVYRGPGSCDEDCSESAFQMAQIAGLEPRYVGPDETDRAVWASAAVYIQPGGHSMEVWHAMSYDMMDSLRDFVAAGGGYVGFCAGGFFASKSQPRYPRLDLLAVRANLWDAVADAAIVTTVSLADGSSRQVYWEGGPYFEEPASAPYRALARYSDGRVAALAADYGNGKVVVSGYHPEAPRWWRDGVGADADGMDWDLAAGMIRAAMKPF